MIEKVTAGVDWISCTLGKEHIGYQTWKGDALYALEQISKAGYQTNPRKLLGYEGIAAGNCFVGENETHGYAQFSGEKADYAFSYLAHPQAHYSRLDVQVTVKRTKMDANEGKRCYRASIDNNALLPKGRRRKIWIIVGSDGGDTVYVGSPSSEQRARIYNKEVQSEDVEFSRCWRYEVVYRNDLSTQLYTTITNSTLERADECLSQVTNWLTKRGVSIRGLASVGRAVLPIERTKPTDVERKLRWLEHQVKPTVAYLTSLGFRALVADVLDLPLSEES